MLIQDVTGYLESIAPPFCQEDYDNAGLITGAPSWVCRGVLICLDATEEVVMEAVEKNCNLVVAHHPILFKGLKKINGNNYVEKAIIRAIKNDVAIYAIHTNLDNIIGGVNKKMADRLGLVNRSVLQTKPGVLRKLFTFVPVDKAEQVRQAIFNEGGGQIGLYNECSFQAEGKGTFKAGAGADPYVGEPGVRHTETELKIEVIFPAPLESRIVRAMIKAHPYEEVAYDAVSLSNYHPGVGSGLKGELPQPVAEKAFLELLTKQFGLKLVRHTPLTGRPVSSVALCGGAGGFLVSSALKAGCDWFVTADVKYHEFFDANGRLVMADIGHYESEQFTIELLHELLLEKFPTFALLKTEVLTNPVNYFCL